MTLKKIRNYFVLRRFFPTFAARKLTSNNMNRLKLLILSLLAVVCLSATGQTDNSKFVTVDNGHFLKDGKPYYYVGTNFWYGAILGSEGQGGDRQRLGRELDGE